MAFLGKSAYAALTREPLINWGRQASPFAGVTAWVLPNPSGLNRSFRTTDLVRAYQALWLNVRESPASRKTRKQAALR